MTIAVITQNTTVQNATADEQYTGVVDIEIKEALPTTNRSAVATVEVGNWATSDETSGLFRFDGLSNVPPNAVVSSAKLWLYMTTTSGTMSIRLRRMLQAWTDAGVTWNTYDGTNAWNTSGAKGVGTDRVSAIESTTAIGSTTGQYYELDCTSLVQDIVDGTITSDEGFHLETDASGGDFIHRVFAASNNTDGQRPELVVEYTAEPLVSAVTGSPTSSFAGGKQIYQFTGSGSVTFSEGGTVEYLIVGGGGGGASQSFGGGGGGAGAFRTGTFTATASAYTITVGVGGAGGTNANGSDGGSSGIVGTNAVGTLTGGSGGGSEASSTASTDGSSGGAGGSSNVAGTSGTYGNDGGDSTTDFTAGGGGGASAVGEDGIDEVRAGNGGNGTASSITGSSVTYAGGGGAAPNRFGTNASGTGGTGGGGDGGDDPTLPTNGTDGLGAGGGGYNLNTASGGDGGDGIVIISYTPPAVSGTRTIGTTGDFTEIRDWANAVRQNGDLTASVIGQLIDDKAYTYHDRADLDFYEDGNGIDKGVYDITFTVESSVRHDGTFGNGARLSGGGQHYRPEACIIEWFSIDNTSTSNFQYAFNCSGWESTADCTLRSCIGRVPVAHGTNTAAFTFAGGNHLIEACVGINGSNCFNNVNGGSDFYNCTAIAGDQGFNRGTGTCFGTLVNCVAYDCGTDYSTPTTESGTYTNNASEDGTHPAGGTPVTLTGDPFVDYSNGDYTPATSGQLDGAGTATGAPTLDNVGNTFNNPPSIGALEIVAGGDIDHNISVTQETWNWADTSHTVVVDIDYDITATEETWNWADSTHVVSLDDDIDVTVTTETWNWADVTQDVGVDLDLDVPAETWNWADVTQDVGVDLDLDVPAETWNWADVGQDVGVDLDLDATEETWNWADVGQDVGVDLDIDVQPETWNWTDVQQEVGVDLGIDVSTESWVWADSTHAVSLDEDVTIIVTTESWLWSDVNASVDVDTDVDATEESWAWADTSHDASVDTEIDVTQETWNWADVNLEVSFDTEIDVTEETWNWADTSHQVQVDVDIDLVVTEEVWNWTDVDATVWVTIEGVQVFDPLYLTASSATPQFGLDSNSPEFSVKSHTKKFTIE